MKSKLWIALITSAFILVTASCSPETGTTPVSTIQLDSTDTSELNQVKASALVVPAQKARLSFVFSGLVKDVTVEEGDQVSVGQALVLLDTSDLEYDLIVTEAALTSAEIEAQLQRQRRKRFNFDTFKFVYVSPPGEKILIADSKVEQIQNALKVVKASIDQGTLMAPFEGTVVAVNVSPGEFVQPGQMIIELAKLDDLKIETTDLSELDVTSVKVGQSATVFIEALNQEFPGKVTAISPISNTIGGDVVYKVTIELDEQPRELLWGMSADVEIEIE